MANGNVLFPKKPIMWWVAFFRHPVEWCLLNWLWNLNWLWRYGWFCVLSISQRLWSQLHQNLISLFHWPNNNILKIWQWYIYRFLRYLVHRYTRMHACMHTHPHTHTHTRLKVGDICLNKSLKNLFKKPKKITRPYPYFVCSKMKCYVFI